MKKALVIILFLLFAAGIYFNFMHTGPAFTDNAAEDTANDTEVTEDGQQESDDTAEEESASEEPAENTSDLTFNETAIQEKYDERVSNNEQLIVDILLPAHYNADFAERLNNQVASDTVQFNQIELPANTTDINELTVNDNSDVVILDALQIADYDDEVLPQRNLRNLTNAYMDLYNADKTVIILGNPNAHEDENLAAELEEDAAYFTENDYFYIDNQDVITENPYDSETLNPALEDEIISSITNYLLQ